MWWRSDLIAAAFAAVGIFVVGRRPDNRVARLFVATGAAHAVLFFCRQYGLREDPSLPGVRWVAWLGVWPLPLVLVLVGWTIMSFPDGSLPSRRWRVAVMASRSSLGCSPRCRLCGRSSTPKNQMTVPHPLQVGAADAAEDVWAVIGPTAYLSFQLVWVACVVVRLRRSRGDEARQLRWFVYAVAVGAAAMVAGIALLGTALPGVLSAPFIAVAAGAAILKYRLYDIDVVINKTLVVSVMAGMVTAAYVAVVVGVGEALGLSASRNVTLSLAATAIIAVAFDPVRRRVQRWVDRLVYGDRPTPYDALARFSGEVTSEGDGADLLSLASAIADGVGASEVTLWVGRRRAGGGGDLAAVATSVARVGHPDHIARAKRQDSCAADRAPRGHVRRGHVDAPTRASRAVGAPSAG